MLQRGIKSMKKAIVIGSGAGGATAAKELQGTYNVTILEAGKAFKPFSLSLSTVDKLKKTGLFFDEREIQLLFPAMKIQKTAENMVMVSGKGVGGTTTISAGNALRMDQDLKALGIDLDAEFEEIYQEIPITDNHRMKWRKTTNRLFEICEDMDLNPQPIPKLGDYERCYNCGQCILGCDYEVKWDCRQYLDQAIENGADLITGCEVKEIVIEKGIVTGVRAKKGLRTVFYPADLVILAAGGFSTPTLLENAQIKCEPNLFVDPVLCVAAEHKGSLQNKEMTMPFAVQREHYIISPYFDFLSFYFNKNWRHPASDTLVLMIKLADTTSGTIEGKTIKNSLSAVDKERLQDGVKTCTEIFKRFGIDEKDLYLGTYNAGHPGGMLPLTSAEAETMHNDRLPENLYVADATLFPNSLGNPPILTIIAMSKKICKLICASN